MANESKSREQLEEEVAKLKQQVDQLKEENQRLKWQLQEQD